MPSLIGKTALVTGASRGIGRAIALRLARDGALVGVHYGSRVDAAEQTVRQIVPDGQKIARVPGVGENGIDDLFKVKRKDVDYVRIEYKFVGDPSKPGSASLGNTVDGRQGSDRWTLGSGRLEKALSIDEARNVAEAMKLNRTETWVVTTRADGSTEVQVLDSFARPKAIDTSKIIKQSASLSGAKP